MAEKEHAEKRSPKNTNNNKTVLRRLSVDSPRTINYTRKIQKYEVCDHMKRRPVNENSNKKI